MHHAPLTTGTFWLDSTSGTFWLDMPQLYESANGSLMHHHGCSGMVSRGLTSTQDTNTAGMYCKVVTNAVNAPWAMCCPLPQCPLPTAQKFWDDAPQRFQSGIHSSLMHHYGCPGRDARGRVHKYTGHQSSQEGLQMVLFAYEIHRLFCTLLELSCRSTTGLVCTVVSCITKATQLWVQEVSRVHMTPTHHHHHHHYTCFRPASLRI
jgi:hypothetical protein